MSDKEIEAITFKAYDVQVHTVRSSGGYRLTFDLSESEYEAASAFLKFSRGNQIFGVSAVPLRRDQVPQDARNEE